MPTLAEILNDPARNGVYRLTGECPPAECTAPALAGRADILRLDGRRCQDKDSLLEAIGHILHFPDYYGMNWDALEECLSDLSWWTGQVIVLIEHANALDRDTLATLVDIWTDAAEAWSREGRVFVLLLAGADEVDTVPAIEA